MSATTAIKVGRPGRLGVMVRTPTELHLYWRPALPATAALRFRICDLTGRPVHESLDGCGYREMPAADSVYVSDLLPGHIYLAEIGESGPSGFTPILAAGPVQTPWLPSADSSAFPSPYYRS